MNQKRKGVKLKHYLLSAIEVERKNPPEYLMNLANEDGKVMMKQGRTDYQGQVPMPENLVF